MIDYLGSQPQNSKIMAEDETLLREIEVCRLIHLSSIFIWTLKLSDLLLHFVIKQELLWYLI